MKVLHCPFERVDIINKEEVHNCLILENKYLDEKDGGDDGSEDGDDESEVSFYSCHNFVGEDELLKQGSLFFLDKVLLVVGSDGRSTCEYFHIAAVYGYLRGLLKLMNLPDRNHEVQVVISNDDYQGED